MSFLLTASNVISSSDFASVLEALSAQISVSTVVQLLVYLAGLCVGFVFMWWGVRKAVRALMGAFKTGKFKL